MARVRVTREQADRSERYWRWMHNTANGLSAGAVLVLVAVMATALNHPTSVWSVIAWSMLAPATFTAGLILHAVDEQYRHRRFADLLAVDDQAATNLAFDLCDWYGTSGQQPADFGLAARTWLARGYLTLPIGARQEPRGIANFPPVLGQP